MATKKLYRITLKDVDSQKDNYTDYVRIYSIATHPTSALNKALHYLESNGVINTGEKELQQIELIADNCPDPACNTTIVL